VTRQARATDRTPAASVAAVRRRLLPFQEKGWSVFLLVWVLSVGYVFPFRNRGWIPHDEGVLGHSAERVLGGEIPHRDFAENYTGGLTYWNALAFRVFGLRSSSLRLALFLSFALFVPAVFAIARRFGSPLAAGLVTLAAAAWSVPNYFAGLPSWYNLFLATWGTLALLRHIETGRGRWLFMAGLLGGISCLFKVIGSYFIAASLLFLLYREQQLSAFSDRPARPRPVSGFPLFLASGLALFLTVLFLMVRVHLEAMEFLHFLVPASTICGFLIWREVSEGGGRFARRLTALMRLILPFLAGVLLPVVLFLIPFAVKGALHDFFRGLIAGTGVHVQWGRAWLPPLSTFWLAVPYTIVLGAGSLPRFRFALAFLVLLVAALAAALWLSGSSVNAYRLIWHSGRSLGVSAVLAACLRLDDAHRLGFWSAETRQKIFLLAAVVAVTGLVQFPFAAPLYFFYFAPLVFLAIFALVQSEPRPPRFVHAVMLAFFLLFALLRTNTGYVYQLGYKFERYDPPAVLDLPRARGLRVIAQDAEVFGSLIPLLREKSGGRPIYAGPDCPEIYFLSGLGEAVPYRVDFPRDPLHRPEELFRCLRDKGTRAVVLIRRLPVVEHFPPEVPARLADLFPHSREIGRYIVRWKE
jgi:hypothetical protein